MLEGGASMQDEKPCLQNFTSKTSILTTRDFLPTKIVIF